MLGYYFRPGKKPWSHEYLDASVSIMPNATFDAMDPKTMGVAWLASREIWLRRNTRYRHHYQRHEEAHIAIHDLVGELEPAHEEALADVVALSRALIVGDDLCPYLSCSASDRPEDELLSLQQIFECMQLSKFIEGKTRRK